MKNIINWKNSSFVTIAVAFLTGCTGTTSVSVGYGVYGGYGYPSYGYGGGYYGGGGYYRPPNRPGRPDRPDRPDRPKPEHPITKPDRPVTKPSRPSTGRPSTRPTRSMSMGRPSGMSRGRR